MKIFLKALLALAAILSFNPAAWAEESSKGSYTEVKSAPKSAEIVKVGFYPISVYQVDMSSNTYYVDAYLWMRWKGDIDPTATIEFTNMVEEWGKLQENLLEEPSTLADGSKYQLMRVEGRFVQPFSLTDFPFDKQRLSVMIEDNTHGAEVISYVIDSKDSGIGNGLEVPGWNIDGLTSKNYVHEYGTRFGDEATASVYSALEFNINISRPESYFLWALLLPLVIVLAAALSALMIEPQEHDVRTGLPAGALLTAIFLQKSYSDDLPELGYMILMDKVYLVAYFLIVMTLVRAIISYKAVSAAGADDKAAITKIHASDKKMLIIQAAIFVISVIAIVNFR